MVFDRNDLKRQNSVNGCRKLFLNCFIITFKILDIELNVIF